MIKLNWTRVTNAEGYEVQQYTYSCQGRSVAEQSERCSLWWWRTIANVTGLAAEVRGLHDGRAYTHRVCSSLGLRTACSNEESDTFEEETTSPQPPQPPTVPTPIGTATPAAYEPFREPPGWSFDCTVWFGIMKPAPGSYTGQSMYLTSTDDGSTHTAEIQIHRASGRLTSETCLGARVTNRSSPGAYESISEGKLYTDGVYQLFPGIVWDSVVPSLAGDFGRFWHQAVGSPDACAPADCQPRTCTNCKGGTIQTTNPAVDASINALPSVCAYSRHTFESGGWRGSVTLSAYDIIPITKALDVDSVIAEVIQILVGFTSPPTGTSSDMPCPAVEDVYA